MTPMKTKLAAALCGLTIAGAGVLSGGLHAFDVQSVAAGNLQSSPTVTAGQNQPTITLEKALEIARGEAQGDVTEIELDREDGVLVWEVRIGTSELYIDANDGTVIQTKTDNRTVTPAAQPKITLEKAVEIARGETQGDITKVELDTEDGVLVWEVRIGDSEVQIDANDGSIVKVKADHDDDDDHGQSDHDDDDHDDD